MQRCLGKTTLLCAADSFHYISLPYIFFVHQTYKLFAWKNSNTILLSSFLSTRRYATKARRRESGTHSKKLKTQWGADKTFNFFFLKDKSDKTQALMVGQQSGLWKVWDGDEGRTLCHVLPQQTEMSFSATRPHSAAAAAVCSSCIAPVSSFTCRLPFQKETDIISTLTISHAHTFVHGPSAWTMIL